jgi:phosphoenolpyruvate-protein kinase (PTS system EI component)
MGLTEFSVQPASLLEVKRVLRSSDSRVLKRRVRRILESTEHADLVRQVEALNAV